MYVEEPQRACATRDTHGKIEKDMKGRENGTEDASAFRGKEQSEERR